jgi:hypothetical protein
VKTEVLDWNEFFKKEIQPSSAIVLDSRDVIWSLYSRKTVIKVTGITALVLLCMPDTAFAAGSGIDDGASRIYKKVVNIGKWVIIIKGGIDCIQAVGNGDIQQAKKQGLGYLLIFGIMLGLPWALDEIEGLFDEVSGGIE